ncbi:uncharacterized protein [Physcomitrium patens]|uniref:Uncharacterized protein n=1 Tax=Physcomitrium patens TaxID=3218 RepID=A0A2K1IU38_PHYPA|nr:uncharacterized protein LOC112272924 [Physcomitrium patens]XP_024356871.1 uncharacterized protein LOC112272924 [Physcomitrium patens]XP_024356872.1 uncharacterized protein LOC112272924 [Physcomitrium patens]XP_024356873.1 uncharacterized protein LOC112272924 [Physcomitrium patens]XP_024356874.1 uncharacterized protein LOC112272924 [Physcomitrium patens]XP_024356875.1 uncharacterized protein LOC112272924 [Physcomitrium patens]XP_024356877.1 uncharacterized protein LOC112272924 [Physcomitriu|eukprot:XP_024356870.1 uncharacterized protein LOC112272924 [Physcomitrella patens]
MTCKLKMMSVRDVGLLFAVTIFAYVLGVLTAPSFLFLSATKTSPYDVSKTQNDSSPVSQPPLLSSLQTSPLHQLQQGRQNNKDCRNQPLPGYRMLPTDLITFNHECKAEAMPADMIRSFLIKELFDGVSPYEHFPPKHVAALLQKERIRGWGSTTTVFRRLMEEVKPKVVIELGSFLGASATHLGAIAKELGLQTDIFCFDDFRGWPGFRSGPFADIKQQNGNAMLMNQFIQNVIYTNLTESILPVPFATVASLSSFCKWGLYADLIEVDASHDFHSAWSDINIAYRLLRPGGVMFGHDYFTAADKRGVRRAVNLFASMNNLRVEPDGQHWIYRRLKEV